MELKTKYNLNEYVYYVVIDDDGIISIDKFKISEIAINSDGLIYYDKNINEYKETELSPNVDVAFVKARKLLEEYHEEDR